MCIACRQITYLHYRHLDFKQNNEPKFFMKYNELISTIE